LRVLLQVPGFLPLFGNFFQAAQRFDYQLGLDLLQNRLLVVALPMLTVWAGRALGRTHPSLGETSGAILGLAAGQYLALAVTFTVGVALFRRLGLPLGPLFHAGFDRATFRDLSRFGAAVVSGKAPFFVANALEIVILTNLLPGYPAWLGIRQLLNGRLVFVLWFAFPFLDSAMPALAEALGAKKHALARYYVARYLQWGHWFVAIVVAFLVGAARPLAQHALSAEWQPVATWLPAAAAVGLFLPSAWLADSFQNGAGRPGLNALLLFVEQALRVALLWLLVPRLGFGGIFAALGLTLALKSVLGWWVNHRLLLALYVPLWPSLGAPLTAGAIFLGLVAGAARLLPATAWFTLGLFGVAALAAFPLGLFLLGLARGLDRAALVELESASALSSFLAPLGHALFRAGQAGARLSPLSATENPLAAAAAREADELAPPRN
jgi:O-antigen/teichoic acid export membrane protein